MAGTGRPRGCPPTRGRGGGRGAKATPTRKRATRKVDSDEDVGSPSASSDGELDQDTAKDATPRPSQVTAKSNVDEKSLSGSTWSSIQEQSEVDDHSDVDVSEEEEDELADEGESVESEIEHLNFRPSTSPIRRRKGITVKTPPTPSPTKNAKKRYNFDIPAPVSPEVDLPTDEEEQISEPITPTRGRKSRVKKIVKSKEIIEDSDIEEISESEHKRSVARKSKQTDNKTSVLSKSIVTAAKKKIVVSGTKFPKAPIEDADNNIFLDNTSSLQRSPKKKAKMTHVSDSEIESSDDDKKNKPDDIHPEDTPVSKITNKLNSSVLNSAKKPKPKKTMNKASYEAHLSKLAASLGLEPVNSFFCDALRHTYADINLSQVQEISLCFGDLIHWYCLRPILAGLGIQKGSKQEKDLVALVTTPEISKFIYNPARCNIEDFRLFTPPKDTTGSRRAYLTRVSNIERLSFLVFGRVVSSSLLELQQMGQSGYSNRSVSLSPIPVEYTLLWSFFADLLKPERVNNFGGYVNFSTFGTRDYNERDAPGYRHQDAAPPPRPRAARAPVTVHRVGENHEDLLLQVLRKGIENGGLDSFSEVPVFNLTSFYGPTSSTAIPHDTETFISLCTQKPSAIHVSLLSTVIVELSCFCVDDGAITGAISATSHYRSDEVILVNLSTDHVAMYCKIGQR
ncbi:hypothetical protein BDY19DRAFT_910426 [Irpex rosettiformis]|uniref:Uncharacterized protein n=1 Tax=Irpex rosettiformis TaxID=378272 RepID=A0ACB8TNT3_9APHY|nr:hypothetical protein BDY19DRAFT_910426 [Irpex rosettiformis]